MKTIQQRGQRPPSHQQQATRPCTQPQPLTGAELEAILQSILQAAPSVEELEQHPERPKRRSRLSLGQKMAKRLFTGRRSW